MILRDIKRVEQIIKDTEQGIVTANYQTGHPHGYISAMYRGELAISKIQYANSRSASWAERNAAFSLGLAFGSHIGTASFAIDDVCFQSRHPAQHGVHIA